MRFGAIRCSRSLHRILQRLGAADREVEMGVGDLEVMLGGDLLAVADPRGHDVRGEAVGKLGLPRGAEVLPRLRPGLESGGLDDAVQLRPQVHGGIAVARDAELGAVFGGLEGGHQVRA
ncbi:MAG: hypothetical protein GY715_20500 [Planctomycetes bacterium]|nr:hypothetical protein [Planctomycetota bacterium]